MARFLTADWRYIVMLNYEVDPAILKRFVPVGTELDLFKGQCFASVVGFMFLNTKLLGVPIPFHRNFEEVNLRFYVKRKVGRKVRRGVVFIKELVPKKAIALVANSYYNENYEAVRMDHKIDKNQAGLQTGGRIEYGWTKGKDRYHLSALTEGQSSIPAASSLSHFIKEHFYGYVIQRDGSTLEYEVDHPSWTTLKVVESSLYCDVEKLYGAEFVAPLGKDPISAFACEGSEVSVMKPRNF